MCIATTRSNRAPTRTWPSRTRRRRDVESASTNCEQGRRVGCISTTRTVREKGGQKSFQSAMMRRRAWWHLLQMGRSRDVERASPNYTGRCVTLTRTVREKLGQRKRSLRAATKVHPSWTPPRRDAKSARWNGRRRRRIPRRITTLGVRGPGRGRLVWIRCRSLLEIATSDKEISTEREAIQL